MVAFSLTVEVEAGRRTRWEVILLCVAVFSLSPPSPLSSDLSLSLRRAHEVLCFYFLAHPLPYTNAEGNGKRQGEARREARGW